MKKLIATVFSIVFIFVFSVSAFASYNVMIDDGANLFTEDEIENINSAAYELASLKDFSVAVVTTEDSMGKTAMEYADDYYDNLIFNSGWSEDGICFLIDMDNREIYVSCAGFCIDEYSDYELNSIVDSGYSYVAAGEYKDCIVTMIYTAEKLAISHDENSYYDSGEYIPTYGDYYEDDYSYYYVDDVIVNKGFDFSHVLIYVIIGVVAGGITVLVIKNSYKNTGIGDEYNADDVFLEVTALNDTVISKNVITTKIPRNNNNHRPGGKGGGGVSVHRSSGGIRHSGAGRKF